MQRCAEQLCAFANSRDGGIIIAGVDQGFRVRTGFWGDVARGLVRAAADRLSCPCRGGPAGSRTARSGCTGPSPGSSAG